MGKEEEAVEVNWTREWGGGHLYVKFVILFLLLPDNYAMFIFLLPMIGWFVATELMWS